MLKQVVQRNPRFLEQLWPVLSTAERLVWCHLLAVEPVPVPLPTARQAIESAGVQVTGQLRLALVLQLQHWQQLAHFKSKY